MRRRIQKWSNSLALRIPQAFAEESQLHEGSAVEVSLRNGKLVVAPLVEPATTLDDLIEQITERNRHHEVEIGGPVGKEVW